MRWMTTVWKYLSHPNLVASVKCVHLDMRRGVMNAAEDGIANLRIVIVFRTITVIARRIWKENLKKNTSNLAVRVWLNLPLHQMTKTWANISNWWKRFYKTKISQIKISNTISQISCSRSQTYQNVQTWLTCNFSQLFIRLKLFRHLRTWS